MASRSQTFQINCPPSECQAPVITNVSSNSGTTAITTFINRGTCRSITGSNNNKQYQRTAIQLYSNKHSVINMDKESGCRSNKQQQCRNMDSCICSRRSYISQKRLGSSKPGKCSLYSTGSRTGIRRSIRHSRFAKCTISTGNNNKKNSILFGCTSDWNGIDGAARVLRDAATDRFYFRNAAKGYTTYYYTKATTSIGTYTEGIQSPTGQKAATAVLEIRCPGPG